MLKQIRRFFDQRNFLEVETPLLSAETVVDRYIEPISVSVDSLPEMWLQTSPEFCMKRLLSAGESAIFQICKAFRNEEIGQWHNPEFTMLEWYRAGDNYQEGMQLLADLAIELLDAPKVERVTYAEIFQSHAGLDPFRVSLQELKVLAKENQLQVDASENYSQSDWLNLFFAEMIEKQIGREHPVIIFDWPADQAALARTRRQGENEVAERFELFYQGVELANGYHELTDGETLRHRNQVTNDLRRKDGHRALEFQSDLVDAMNASFPDCSGVAMGLDRVLMSKFKMGRIGEVLNFPIDRA